MMTFSLKVVILISSSSGLLLSLSTVCTVFFTILFSIFNICMNYIILIMTLNSHQTFVRVHMYIKHLIFLCHLQHLIISFFYQSLRISAHISHTLSFKRNACYWLRKKSVGNYTMYIYNTFQTQNLYLLPFQSLCALTRTGDLKILF